VSGKGHAEATVIRAAEENGQTVLGVGASWGICSACENVIRQVGARIGSALKEP
jgi:hypothetical protein